MPRRPTPTRTDSRSAVIEAAARLLHDQGAGAVTTRAVAQAAGVQPPTIFRLFGDKDGLLEAVAEHVLAGYVADKTVAVTTEDGDPVEHLRAAWHTNIDFGLANPDLYGLLVTPGRLQQSPAMATGNDVFRTRVARVAAAGLLRVSEARAVDMLRAAGNGVVLTLLTQPEAGRDPALADALLDAVMARILTTAPAPPTSDAATLAVALRAAVPELPALTEAERGLMSEWLARAIERLQG
ncbi:TetR/AcrR family transcriptional regulator [Antribacter sp. KLBMP9083]|uniref:TetR/AcrR family transcriptional regulator n=1 Tax=Antribacter soli TaxID=2910976 RepID=A0AA41QCX8_9MICO|nr:TetR/AcrR family transcriptional regulator [Antribacter soli]MCF4121144.1 TetR/AcrR family transcriptional regulator [Antribacter soli]